MIMPDRYNVDFTLRCRRSGIGPAGVSLLGALLSWASAASALQFDVKQISDDAIVSREPTIGNSSLIAWVSAYTNEIAGGATRVTIFDHGQRRDLENPEGGQNSAKPQAFSNSLVWIASFANTPGDLTVRLKEVPWRDEGGMTELRALYSSVADSNGVVSMVAAPTGEQFSAVFVTNSQGMIETTNIVEKIDVTNEVRRHPRGDSEILYWTGGGGAGTGNTSRLTRDGRADLAPSIWNEQVSWQKEKGWPFGWEIFFWKDGVSKQLTTNFYYDMAPKVQGRLVVWYGWDGHDFEIFMYDNEKDITSQITSNRYDDVAPVIWNGDVAWEGYESTAADIFLYHTVSNSPAGPVKGITNISKGNPDDDINPRIWDGKVVWQSFDGDDFEIYYYDGQKTYKLTSNNYDDVNPDIRDGLVVWQGYKDNWDAEIFAWEISSGFTKDAEGNTVAKDVIQITDNNVEDRDPRTSNHHIVWQQDETGKSRIMLATPK